MWKSARKQLPAFGVNVLVAIDGKVQPYVYYADANDNELSLEYFWDCDYIDNGFLIEDNHHWMEVPPVS